MFTYSVLLFLLTHDSNTPDGTVNSPFLHPIFRTTDERRGNLHLPRLSHFESDHRVLDHSLLNRCSPHCFQLTSKSFLWTPPPHTTPFIQDFPFETSAPSSSERTVLIRSFHHQRIPSPRDSSPSVSPFLPFSLTIFAQPPSMIHIGPISEAEYK